MTVDTPTFKTLVSRFPSGVTVVTASHDGHLVGATVSSFASVSFDPPLVSVCLKLGSRTAKALTSVGAFAVNVLREDQLEIAHRFARPGNGDRFDNVNVRECDVAQDGVPVLCDSLATILCRVYDYTVMGDHVVVFGLVIGGRAREGTPLVHSCGEFGCVRELP